MLRQLVLKDGVLNLMESNPTLKLNLLFLSIFLVSCQFACRLSAPNNQIEIAIALIESLSEEICAEFILFRFLFGSD